MTKNEIAKKLRDIGDQLKLCRLGLRGKAEDKLLDLLDASIEAEEAITDLILDFNAGKLPRKTPARTKSTQVFYIERLDGAMANEWGDEALWDDKPTKKKFTTSRGWQKEFEYRTRDLLDAMIDIKVFDANKKLIARFRRDEHGTITHNKGR